METTGPALPYDYACFADGVLHLKTSFERSSFNFLNVFFTMPLSSQKNEFVCVIQPNFIVNNLMLEISNICYTSNSVFLTIQN